MIYFLAVWVDFSFFCRANLQIKRGTHSQKMVWLRGGPVIEGVSRIPLSKKSFFVRDGYKNYLFFLPPPSAFFENLPLGVKQGDAFG